ncbi:MAG: hypothetical protein ACTSP0_05085 [Alphaproteobacteria bacterium]
MLTQFRPSRPRNRGFYRHAVRFYCRTCGALFGKTLSFMAGEAHALGKWYGGPCCQFINWLLRDPMHCANELRNAKYVWLRAS